MRKFLMIFLSFVVLYHVLVTYISFGQGRLPPYVLLLIRDIGWLAAIGWFLIDGLLVQKWYKKLTSQFFSRRGWVLFIAILITVIGIVVSIFLGVDTKQIFVGIKYSLYYLIPFFSAIYIGLYWKEKLLRLGKESDKLGENYYTVLFKKFIYRLWIGVVAVIIVGWLWQVAKNIFPNWFIQFGYGPLGDYVFGEKPPLYYLTGPHGFQRLSGLFSGPNNYGYFLVAFFGLYWFGIRHYVSQKYAKIGLWALYIITLLATFSRGAVLGVLVQVILISYVIYHTERKIILGAIIAGLLAVGMLSVLKRDSTLAHLQAKFSSLQYVSHAPRGFGLGSSGPSSLSQGGYLPENFFVQLMMDLGVVGFVLWGAMRIVVLHKIRSLYFRITQNRTLLFFLTVGFIGLMIEGLFLHVLEDSMVNYLYFVVWGFVLGYSEKSFPVV